MKFRPGIADHDYETMRNHISRFLKGGDKVKVSVMFKGRAAEHADLGEALLNRLVTDLENLAIVESAPSRTGRDMVMVLGPTAKARQGNAPQNGSEAASPVDEERLRELTVAAAPRLLADLEQADAALEAGESRSMDELITELDEEDQADAPALSGDIPSDSGLSS
jgi:translation initiation factor IF-3